MIGQDNVEYNRCLILILFPTVGCCKHGNEPSHSTKMELTLSVVS